MFKKGFINKNILNENGAMSFELKTRFNLSGFHRSLLKPFFCEVLVAPFLFGIVLSQ